MLLFSQLTPIPVPFISRIPTSSIGHPIELGYAFVFASLRGWRDGCVAHNTLSRSTDGSSQTGSFSDQPSTSTHEIRCSGQTALRAGLDGSQVHA